MDASAAFRSLWWPDSGRLCLCSGCWFPQVLRMRATTRHLRPEPWPSPGDDAHQYMVSRQRHYLLLNLFPPFQFTSFLATTISTIMSQAASKGVKSPSEKHEQNQVEKNDSTSAMNFEVHASDGSRTTSNATEISGKSDCSRQIVLYSFLAIELKLNNSGHSGAMFRMYLQATSCEDVPITEGLHARAQKGAGKNAPAENL
jgi:hypothetical protein